MPGQLTKLKLMPDEPGKLEIQDGDGVSWHAKTMSRFSADGRVVLVNADGIAREWYDLTKKHTYVF